jgi:hypothetical protein
MRAQDGRSNMVATLRRHGFAGALGSPGSLMGARMHFFLLLCVRLSGPKIGPDWLESRHNNQTNPIQMLSQTYDDPMVTD